MSDTELEGGTLWQWDTGRTVEVTDAHAGDVMDFARNGMDEALTVSISDDGKAFVPNQLLKEPGTLCWWLRRGEQTVTRGYSAIVGRPQPPDYVYVETPTVGYAQLLERVEEVERIVGSMSALEYATDEDIDRLYEKGASNG